MQETIFQKAISEAMKIQEEMESDFQFDLEETLKRKTLEFPLYHTLFGIYEVFDSLETYNDKDLFLFFLEYFWEGQYVGLDTINNFNIYLNIKIFSESRKVGSSFFYKVLDIDGKQEILDLLVNQ